MQRDRERDELYNLKKLLTRMGRESVAQKKRYIKCVCVSVSVLLSVSVRL